MMTATDPNPHLLQAIQRRLRAWSVQEQKTGGNGGFSTKAFFKIVWEVLLPVAFYPIGAHTTMLVPRPGAVRMSNLPFSFFTLARMLAKPNPSLVSALVVIPRPLSFTRRTRFGGWDRKLTLIAVDLAWRSALLIAS